jgi:hypothetical protein
MIRVVDHRHRLRRRRERLQPGRRPRRRRRGAPAGDELEVEFDDELAPTTALSPPAAVRRKSSLSQTGLLRCVS